LKRWAKLGKKAKNGKLKGETQAINSIKKGKNKDFTSPFSPCRIGSKISFLFLFYT
jgi:hypothetical protein